MQPYLAIKRNRGRSVLFLILFVFSFRTCIAQPLNYCEIFGSDWQKALLFVEDNNTWIKPVLEKYKIPYYEAIAVIFPELVRYSALRDKMEITLLKTLYSNLGDDYADFSIGVFQVKPSFAERVRVEASSAIGWKARTLFKKREVYKNDREYRSAIISDLEDPVTEFNYIIAFFKICEKHFTIDYTDEASKIRFLATAYNAGFWKSKEEIIKMCDLKFFNTKLFKTENYSYADVSLFWYNQYIQTE
jgi:hypothetical protein